MPDVPQGAKDASVMSPYTHGISHSCSFIHRWKSRTADGIFRLHVARAPSSRRT